MIAFHRFLLCLLCAGLASGTAAAQTRPSDLANVTLEDLMKIEITSASRRGQLAEDAPAAVYVIGADEIRRSGMTSIPDLLRLAPGVHVAQINSNKWSVSVRGFGSLYSNKLLVLVDGRSIYNPAFAAVLWDTEDLMVEDIERIEIIRGPGAAMWGANAVNGVINIITRSAADTRGGLARVSGGAFDAASAAFRYGGGRGALSYRGYAQATAHGSSTLPDGLDAGDHWHSVTGGFRADRAGAANALMVQGSITAGEQRPLWVDLDLAALAGGARPSDKVSQARGAHVLGRWTRTFAGSSSLQLQGFVDVAHRSEAIGVYDRRTWDIDATYHVTAGGRHDLVAGGGYRYITEAIDGCSGYTFTPNRARPIIYNAFAQDTIALAGRRVELTLGGKYEDNSFAGSGFQPTARVLWRIGSEQRAWASVSRALRTPSLIDRGLHVALPPMPQPDGTVIAYTTQGNPDVGSEHFADVEAGYRVNVGAVAFVDVTAFAGRYDDLQFYEPQAPRLLRAGQDNVLSLVTQTENVLGADTHGVEVAGRVQLPRAVAIDGAFSTFHLTPDASDSRNPSARSFDGRVPRYQWRGHAALPVTSRGQADVHLFQVGSIGQIGIPAYARLDARFEWKLTAGLSLIARGQNLLAGAHAEFDGMDTNMVATFVPRRGHVRLVWTF